MRCAANKATTVKGVSYGNGPNNRCVGATLWRRRWLLGSQSRLLVIRCVLTLGLVGTATWRNNPNSPAVRPLDCKLPNCRLGGLSDASALDGLTLRSTLKDLPNE
jgi:hypothetical protein